MDSPAPALVIASTQPYQGDAKQRQAEVVVCSNLTATVALSDAVGGLVCPLSTGWSCCAGLRASRVDPTQALRYE